MINFVYGLPGTGKTTLISKKISEDIAAGRSAILIVPEQQTVEMERYMLRLLPASAQLGFEVLNFSRLANKLFRLFGGLSYNYISDGMKNLFMKRTLLELAPMLSEYRLRAVGDSALPSLMLAQINEFKTSGISATSLELAAGKLDDGHPLKTKLSDLSAIYQAYEGLVKNSYDDSSNDLEKLYELLCEHTFFKDTNVYIDGFTSFTAVQHKIIKRIFAQAENCFVTFPAANDECSGLYLSTVAESSRRLRIAAGNSARVTVLNEPHRAKTPEARRILTSLWDFSLNTSKLVSIDDPNYVSLTGCSDPYEEAFAVANKVLELLNEGYRRRDIAVIAGNMDEYKGIIDSAFEKAGIPYFMSEKTALESEPLIAFILSAFSIKLKNWRPADIIAYLKTGLTDVSQSDADVFEIYISTWKISGSRFFDDFWTMNPDGYSAAMSQRGTKILECANRVKDQLVAPLAKFFAELDSAKSVAELCDATYEFFKAMRLSEKMKERTKKAHHSGNRKSALECAGTHKAFVRVLSDISASMGDADMTVEEFASSLRLVLKNTSVGTIPTAADEVILGSASMLRASGVKCAILIGMCDGKFPAQVSETGFFSDNEKSILKELDIELSGDTMSRSSDELLFAHRAMTLPSDKLFLFYHFSADGKECKPSLAVSRIFTLLPGVHVTNYKYVKDEDRLFAKKPSFEALRSLSPAVQDALISALGDDPEYNTLLDELKTPISDTDCGINEEIAKKFFGNSMYLSQSKLENYVKCHFLYYCKNVLKLRETDTVKFSYSETGTFIHRILENFIRAAVDENGLKAELSFDEIKKSVLMEADAYINEIFKDRLPPSKRLLHQFKRLKNHALLIAADLYTEISQSDFVPRFFELEIGRGGENSLPAYELTLDDKSTVALNGIVDRVDIYKKDNDVYIKVIDYKTGSKSFSISNVEKGLNMQMLLYLFAICKTSSKKFRSSVGASEGTLKPASVMYVSTKIPLVDASGGATAEDIFRIASESISREGLLLNDEEILAAINKDDNAKYIMNAKSPKKADSVLATKEQFAELEALVNKTISDIVSEMRSGNASAKPMDGDNSPCEYCKMKQFCRIDRDVAADGNEENEGEEE